MTLFLLFPKTSWREVVWRSFIVDHCFLQLNRDDPECGKLLSENDRNTVLTCSQKIKKRRKNEPVFPDDNENRKLPCHCHRNDDNLSLVCANIVYLSKHRAFDIVIKISQINFSWWCGSPSLQLIRTAKEDYKGFGIDFANQ
jgi:hypothetical protein